ncbi:MAG: ChaB family protein [Deltaproteobacteria bacterium]|nr:ChaB family protein [Deltaproteobacteria bacterium]
MPYSKTSELPKGVKNNLPAHAQSIWMSAFNSAYTKHGEKKAIKIAWGAVKNAGYIKKAGKWVRKKVQLSALLDMKKKKLETLAVVTARERKRKQSKKSEAQFYAFPRLKKLPIFDAAHVRNAMARFNQTQGMTSAEKTTAKRKIMAAAKKYGIEVGSFQKLENNRLKTDKLLQELLNTIKNTNFNKELEQLSITFKINEELSSNEGDLYISGIALAEGTYHGKYYPNEILPEIAKQLVGKPLKMAHGKKPKDVVGRVTGTKYDAGLRQVGFRAKVFDELAKKLIEEELYADVSIGVWIDKFNDVFHGWTAANPEVDELSILEKGECPQAKIKHKEYLHEVKSNA